MQQSDRNIAAMATPNVHTDFSGKMSYGDYLHLDTLLTAQHPLSDAHDELLFVIIHQVKELWMKLMNHELDTAIAEIRADQLRPAFKCLARISRIQQQLIQAWDVLSTMTPADYLSFRPVLGQSSGFQSWQYRLLEFKLGLKNEAMMRPHAHRPETMAALDRALSSPSVYDEALRLLARRGLPIPEDVLAADVRQRHVPDARVEAVWATIYRNAEQHFDLYELAEELVDLEDAFQTWRFRHMKTVERIIGMRPGTGGSAGVSYLKSVLDLTLFPELWSVRTAL
jgi:tryptophan 2,3-dioxygenase